MKWSGYEWITQERWGQIHPDKPISWYDSSAVHITKEGYLLLKTHQNSKYFPDLSIESKIGVGLVSCKTHFSYGYYEIECKLPRGKNLWPAFWMWSFDSWPPEIDVFEGYTKRTRGYFSLDIRNPLGFWNVNTNIHLGKSPTNYSVGAKTHWMGIKDPSRNFMKYGCLWEKDKIEIYYNGRMVRSITDKNVLNELKGTTMNVVINNGVEPYIIPTDHEPSEFVIKYFKFIPSKS